MPINDDVNNLLDKCIVLNTYLNYYFKPLNIIDDYSIRFRMDAYADRKDFYSKDGSVQFNNQYCLFG